MANNRSIFRWLFIFQLNYNFIFSVSQGTGQPPQDPHVATPVPKTETAVRPKLFFDVAANGKPLGRIEMMLFDDVVPKTTTNFKALANGIFNPKYIMCS